MTNNASSPVALITGAAQRIGAAIARELHSRGFNIIVHFRNSAQAADALCCELNGQREDSAVAIQASLEQRVEILQLATAVEKQWGRLDALINNASDFYPTPIATACEDDWDRLLDSNLKGPFFLSQALAPALQQSQGCILNMIDIHAQKPLLNHSIYCLAKAGLANLTQSLAKELAPKVRVNGIAPGAILWPQQDGSDCVDEKEKQEILDKVPLARAGTAADIAGTAAFLITGAPYITGQILAVDGGRSLSM